MNYQLIEGDCLTVMAGMEAESVSSILTDAPYGLSDHPQAEVLECLRCWINGEVYKPKGKGFMNKGWDSWVPGPEVWRECLRVLKPGGHMLVFAGTRSMDLMSMAIRLAGFELRDNIGYAHSGDAAPLLAWVYGSGFPHGTNISKAIDAKLGAEREVIGAGRSGKTAGMQMLGPSGIKGGDFDITAPATDAARAFDGYFSNLKPAWEPIIIAMKPVDGTFAENALKHGLAGLNIGECRVGTADDLNPNDYDDTKRTAPKFSGILNGGKPGQYLTRTGEVPNGRFASNFIHDGSDEVNACFPTTAPAKAAHRGAAINSATFKSPIYDSTVRGHNDSGGSAARFFYCAKSSSSERSAGLAGMEKKQKYSKDGKGNSHEIFTSESANDSEWAKKNPNLPHENFHPTVKPISLMRYLCRLVKPPTGGVILDPFMGSGSTGVAALLEGVDFIGIEKEAEYMEIARQRIEHYEDERSVEPIKRKGKAGDFDNLPMFAEVG